MRLPLTATLGKRSLSEVSKGRYPLDRALGGTLCVWPCLEGRFDSSGVLHPQLERPVTRLTLETCYGKVSVEVKEDDLNIEDLWRTVIEPLLLGAGYAESTIKSLFDESAP